MSLETPLASTHDLFCAALQRLGGAAIFSHGDTQSARAAQFSSHSPRGGQTSPICPEFSTRCEAGRIRWLNPGSDVVATPVDTVPCNDLRSYESTGATSAGAMATLPQQLMQRERVMPAQDAQRRLHHLRFFCSGSSLVEAATASEAQQTSGHAFTAARSTCGNGDCNNTWELKARYFQVAKETLTAITGRRLRTHLLGDDSTAGPGAHLLPPDERRAARASGVTTAARQVALRRDMGVFMNAVAHQESMLNAVAAACRTQLLKGGSAASISAPCHFFSRLPPIPMQHWAGSHLYNDCFVRYSTPDVSVPQAATKPKRSGLYGAPTLTSGSAPRGAPKALGLPLDIETELSKYWKLHSEAEARARLNALRSNDAEAFAEHISLLKVSSLLKIMEKTEDFMRRIGLRLQSHATPASADGGGGKANALSTTHTALTALDELGDTDCPGEAARCRSGDYQRFRAYVTSTKNEFKLVHSVDAFVSCQPAGLDATLLPHQMDGLRFLASLDANHINGILADEMGVGKTIQTLAFFLYLKNRGAAEPVTCRNGGRMSPKPIAPHLPHLVLAPLSVVREWREACEQFVSNALRVAVYQELDDPVRDAKAYDIVLLPIHAVRRVGAEAARIGWHYLVVDEAHKAVANLGTITARSILNLRCLRRLVLTGTPLSSDLQELWSLLFFLNPSVFADKDSFDEVFRRPFRVYAAQEMELTEEERGLLILRLHQVLRPFLLRRTKADVDATLRMTFHHLWCPLSAMQQRLLFMMREQRRTPAVFSVTGDQHSAMTSTSSSTSEAGDDASMDAEGAAGGTSHTSASPELKMGSGQCVGYSECGAAPVLASEARQSEVSPSLDTLKAHNEAHTNCDELTELVLRYLPALASAGCNDALRCAVQRDRAFGLTSAGVSESTAQFLCNHAFLLPFCSQVLHRHGLDEVTQEGYSTADSIATATLEHRVLEAEAVDGCGAAGLTLACSGKFLILHLLLSRLYVAQHKVVLFTHWLDCVDLLVDYVHSRGWASHTEVLTGGSSEVQRVTSVRRFREDPGCLFFILSVQAGGCGINLQVAHVVVLVDRDYTATNEDQALARVYRIGQRHTVRAVYLTTSDPSEQRVAQRAASKNKPRQAIINDGVFQVTRAGEEERLEEPEGIVEVATFADPQSNPGNDLDTCALWSSIPGATTPLSPTAGCQEAPGPGCEDAVHDPSGSAPDTQAPLESFWVSLSRLVDSMDQLVLTEEDRAAATSCSTEEVRDDVGCAPTTSVVARLLATRPPMSTADLHLRLERESGKAFPYPHRDSGAVLSLSSISAGDVSSGGRGGRGGGGEDSSEAFVAGEGTGFTTASEPQAAALVASVVLPPLTHPSAPTTDPLRNSALFWLEYSHLLRIAKRGPELLIDSLNTAVSNDSLENDPEEQRRRRQRRDRRVAKRMRLVSVDVPDSFREACWTKEGVDDDAEVAARYLRFLDSRARKRRQRRRKETA
ncbi:hypothetical protein JKF63_02929 [Porcisia hertigi]|uniref:SNF2 N-terminal domain family protein n=1 Tax=Porcisia hertigi TaxID=2761500 RepID=A0A836INC1_9TRYP|nr:hypothetical protein JKF63_02929 [Porcisia hertigi]